MDKYEYNIKSDKIKKLVERKDYETAVKIADTIDWERVRNIKMLSTVSLAYEKMSRFEEAKDLLLMAYECAPVGRRFLYKLTELATKQGEYDEAEDYLKEFAATSPQDPSRLILRYEISKAKGEPTERLITILETYQKREFEEKWSYELANLYYRVGKNDECVKLCDEIVLWFGVGTYVDKAMELKQRIAPLTPDQIEKRENKEKYLRRLEEVQKEFEDRYRVLEEPTKAAVEAVVNQVEVPVAETSVEVISAEEVPAEEIVEDIPVEEVSVEENFTEESVEKMDLSTEDEAVEELLEEAVEEVIEMSQEESEEEKSIEGALTEVVEEMETSLAREIEAAALTAALNEVMLRETAATMESMEVVENDHSQDRESTKVAVVRVSMQDKTKEFVREAKVINVILEEAPQRVVTAEEVEARLQEELLEEMPVAEEVAEEEVPAEKSFVEETIEEEILPEEPVMEVAVVEELFSEGFAAEETTEESIEEEVVAEESVIEEVSEEEIPVEESVEEETAAEEFSEEAPAALDHYVLVACDDETEGVKECVSYIRRMRELLGRPVTQVAKIQGAKLATKDMTQTLYKLKGRDLVVVGISGLPDAVLNQTVELMAEDTIESFIALVGTEDEIASLQSRQAFFAGCRVLNAGEEAPALVIPEAVEEEKIQEKQEALSLEEEQSMLAKMVEEALRASLFATEEAQEEVFEETPEEILEEMPETIVAAGVDLEATSIEVELTPKAFYECAVQYANMMDAKVDEMGGLAIYAAAEEFRQEREPLTEELAQELVDNAIQKAERRTLKSLFSNRYDKEGFLILKEQHFKD